MNRIFDLQDAIVNDRYQDLDKLYKGDDLNSSEFSVYMLGLEERSEKTILWVFKHGYVSYATFHLIELTRSYDLIYYVSRLMNLDYDTLEDFEDLIGYKDNSSFPWVYDEIIKKARLSFIARYRLKIKH